MNLDVGSTVGDYQIIAVLGAGGMGKVFKVRNTISDRVEAMKVLLPDLTGEPDLADRFLREIKVLASLDHPNIAGLRTALRFENQLLMVMELVEGVSLDERLRQGPLPVADAVGCISQVLYALGYAHSRGVIHRDIKPANMMLTPDGTVKLMDFGIAKGATDRKLTMTGTTMGSLYYMSPEQIRGEQTLDPRSDLYSVGVSLYELVTGKRPFDGDSQFAIMSAHLEREPVPPIQIEPRLPAQLNELILLSVKRDAGARFQTADAFRNALNSVAAAVAPTLPLAQPRTSSPAPQAAPAVAAAAAPEKSHRALWATVGALCCVAALVAAIEFGPWKKVAADSSARPPAAANVATPSPNLPPAQPTAPATEPAAALAVVPAASTPASEPAQSQPVTPVQKSKRPAVSSSPVSAANTIPAAPAVAAPQPAAVSPAQQPTAPAPPPQAPPQPDLSAQRAELQKLREAYAGVSARALSVHSTLENLQRSQAAGGLGLRGDWLTAANLMDSFFKGSSDAIAAGDAPAAKDLMDKGERQLEKLEKALNK